ncbi:MAG TPA: hypothetical protein VJ765_13520 [Chitinophagaceae bacterium]|nr:hypothetical protein [Chitinophagaceae bacterium]
MKNILATLGLFGLVVGVNAQRVVEKTMSFSGKDAIKLEMHISDSIGIATWTKNEVYVKATININDNKYNDEYKVRFEESGNTVAVIAKFETDRKTNWRDDSGTHTSILWEVFIPENARFSVDAINANITIVGKTDEIKASTISGFIDLSLASERKVDIKMSTVTGTVYSNVISSADAGSSKKKHDSNVSTELNGGGKLISLKTVSGDIYLRKQ